MLTVKTTDDYLYEKKRDILILEMRIKEDGGVLVNRKECEKYALPQLTWFNQQGIETHKTVPPNILVGWCGHYYVDVDLSSEVVKNYSLIFEDHNGDSREPTIYQMIALSYDEWKQRGGIEKHEDYLKYLEDGNDI